MAKDYRKILRSQSEEYKKKDNLKHLQWMNKNRTKEFKRDRIKYYKELKGGKCSKCGYSKNYAALDFHHLDPATKKFGIIGNQMTVGKSERIELEVAKCILLCHNCHMELHHPELNKA